MSDKTNFEWLKKHADTVVVLASILSSVFWMNGKFNYVDQKIAALDKEISIVKSELKEDIARLDKEISIVKSELKEDIARLDKEISIIKTVLIMHRIMPQEMAHEPHTTKEETK